MDIANIRWSYCIAKAGPQKELQVESSVGPLPVERIREIVGGEYLISRLRDSTAIAYLADQSKEDLSDNEHYPGIKGDVLVGKMPGGVFLGLIGIDDAG